MEYGMFKRLTLLSLLLVAAGAQYGCGYLGGSRRRRRGRG